MYFTNTKNGNFAKDPAVVHIGDRYYLYHSIMPSSGKLGIGIAESHDMEEWNVIGEIPITQSCERNGIGAPGAAVIDGKVHLYYQTYGNRKHDAICRAVSDDGISFVKDAENPIFSPSSDWCCGRAIDADVCLFKGKLYLYFATRDHAYKIQKLGCAVYENNKWNQCKADTILEPELDWEGECIEAPASVAHDGRVYLFYGGAYNCSPQQIGCAVSDDGVNFRRISEKPFLCNGKRGSWNSDESGHPYVFEDNDGKVYLFYQGTNDKGKTWYISKTEIVFKDGGWKIS